MKTSTFILIVILAAVFLSGCEESQGRWGNGDTPAEFQGWFGNSNLARLNFVQTEKINQHNARLDALEKLNAEQHELMGKMDIKIGARVTALEEAQPETVKELQIHIDTVVIDPCESEADDPTD